jgi:hypothetical protein
LRNFSCVKSNVLIESYLALLISIQALGLPHIGGPGLVLYMSARRHRVLIRLVHGERLSKSGILSVYLGLTKVWLGVLFDFAECIFNWPHIPI